MDLRYYFLFVITIGLMQADLLFDARKARLLSGHANKNIILYKNYIKIMKRNKNLRKKLYPKIGMYEPNRKSSFSNQYTDKAWMYRFG